MLKTIILTYFLIAFFTFNSKAQDFWERVVFFDTIGINNMGFNSSGNAFIATIEGVFKSGDNGENWELTSLDKGACCLSIAPDDAIFVISTYNSNLCLYKSVNEGNTWDSIHIFEDNIPFNTNASYISSNYIMIYGAMGGIYKSADSGYTWTQVLSTVNSEVFNDIIEKDTFLFAGSTHFLSSSGGGVYRSSDDGDTWEHVSMAGHGVSSFALDIDGNLLAGVRFNYSYIDYGVFRSYDNGILWDNLLPGHLVTSLAVDEFGGIYAGCDSDFGPEGVQYSYNNGLSWEALNAGLHDDAYITSLAISPADYIFATTYSPNYLYRSINPIVSISEKSREQLDIKVFPNPFQDRINLHFNNLNCNNEKLIIKIVNSLGQNIYSCENSVNNEFSLNLEKLPSGLYYCLIRIGTTEHNIKLIKK